MRRSRWEKRLWDRCMCSASSVTLHRQSSASTRFATRAVVPLGLAGQWTPRPPEGDGPQTVQVRRERPEGLLRSYANKSRIGRQPLSDASHCPSDTRGRCLDRNVAVEREEATDLESRWRCPVLAIVRSRL
jgi:hypothetical protein